MIVTKGRPLGSEWLDPSVEAGLQRPKGRGRPIADFDARRWATSVHLAKAKGRFTSTDCEGINRDVLAPRAHEISQRRRDLLTVHRADGRREGQRERWALIAGLMVAHPKKTASWIAVWLKRSCPSLADVSVRTLRADVGSIRRTGSATPR